MGGTQTLKEALRPFYLRWLYFKLFPARRPPHFEQCWRYPDTTEFPPASVEPDLLFLPMTDWHTRIQRTQHLAKTFAALGHRCLYLNPHLGREFPTPYLLNRESKVCTITERIAEVHVHLRLEPVFHDRLLSSAESQAIADVLLAAFQEAGTKQAVQVVSFPVWKDVALQVRKELNFPIVYDCHDVLGGFANIAPEIVKAEEELFETSDLIAFSARNLMENNTARHPQIRSKSVLVRNAVDGSWIAKADEIRGPGGGAGPLTIGYIGALDFWFDVESMAYAATKHPEWQFVLVGRVEDARVLSLRRYSNVRFTGEVPHAELWRQMAEMRVALIPFLRNELTIGTNPIKLYEYFAYGLPVVATRLPELEEFGRLVYIYEGRESFVAQLQSAVAEDDGSLRADRVAVAHRETWGARVEVLRQAFTELPSGVVE